jgi:hypothetical protein
VDIKEERKMGRVNISTVLMVDLLMCMKVITAWDKSMAMER